MRRARLGDMLYWRVAPTIVATILAVGALAFFSARHQINRSFDAQLRSNAGVLWMLVAGDVGQQNNIAERRFSLDERPNLLKRNSVVGDYVSGRMFRIWRRGHIVMLSDNALPESTPPCVPGFSNVRAGDDNWRVFSLGVNDSTHIEVGEKTVLRRNFLNHILADLTLPLIALMPAVGFLLWIGIGSGLRTLRMLGKQLQNRSPDDLSAIDDARLPSDLTPLVRSLNTLLEKLDVSINAERRFADHVAHQLRTPLAGLKLQLQMMDMADNASRAGIVAGMTASVDRAAGLINQLLLAARVVHQPLQVKNINLYDLVASIIADTGAVIVAKRLDVSLDGPENIVLKTDETLLTLLIANIVDNAVKFTPVAGRIAVTIAEENEVLDHYAIFVQDSGPGIPADKREIVFEKFSRLDNETKVEGAGLGLSIVADIVERLRGHVELGDIEGSGLLVRIHLAKNP